MATAHRKPTHKTRIKASAESGVQGICLSAPFVLSVGLVGLLPWIAG